MRLSLTSPLPLPLTASLCAALAACGRSIHKAAVRTLLVASAAACGVSVAAESPSPQPQAIDHIGWSAKSPLVAIDSQGNATVVWRQSSRYNQPLSLWSNRYIAKSDAWGAERMPLTRWPGTEPEHDITVVPSGDAFVIAGDNDSTVVHRFSVQSQSWDKEWTLEKGRATRYAARIAADPQGNVLAVWTRDGKSNMELWASYYSATSGRWSPPEVISAATGSARDPELAFDGKGNAVVVWNAGGAILARRFTSGVWEPLHTVADPGSDKFHLAVSRNGIATLMWEFDCRLRAARYEPGLNGRGAWGSAVDIDHHDGAPCRKGTSVAMDDSGNAVVAWAQEVPGEARRGVYTSRFVASGPGGTWSQAQYVSSKSGDLALNHTSLVVDAKGSAFVAWTEKGPNGRNHVYTNRQSPGQGWGQAIAVMQSDIFSAWDLSMASGLDGTVMLVWKVTDNQQTVQIMAHRLAAGPCAEPCSKAGAGTAQPAEVGQQDRTSYCTAARGRDDALAGRLPSAMCQTPPAVETYRAGYGDGIQRFCTAENGIQRGRSGLATRSDICPSNLLEFQMGYTMGGELYDLNRQLERIAAQQADARKVLADLETSRTDRDDASLRLKQLDADKLAAQKKIRETELMVSQMRTLMKAPAPAPARSRK